MSMRRAASDIAGARVPLFPWRQAGATCLVFALAMPAGPHAQDLAPPSATVVQPDELIATLVVNGVAQGEFRVARTHDGDTWLRAEDLPRLQLQPRAEAQRSWNGETWYAVSALGASGVRFDEPTLTLHVDFRPEVLPATRVDLSQRLPAVTPGAARNSLVLSYHLSAIEQQHHASALASTDLDVRIAGVLLRQEMHIDTSRADKGWRRGVTQLVRDNLQDATRLIVGDTVSSAGSFGSAITGAGVQYSRVFDLAPDLLYQPTAQIQASTALPADVEVSVDGTPVYRGHVAPGPLTLDNLKLSGGTRTVRVVITDTSGRRQVIEQPFLFTDSVLARGIHEFSYFGGRRSELGADDNWHYREPAWQAFHRFGATDSVTLAAGGEGSRDFSNAGGGITLRLDRIGLVALEALASHDRSTGHTAPGAAARYTYLSPWATFVLGRRQFAPGSRSFATGVLSPFPRSESRIGTSTHWRTLTLAADYVRTVTVQDVRHAGVLRASASIGHGWWLMADWQTTRIDDQRGWAANVYLRADLDTQRWVAATAHFEPDHAHRIGTEAGKQLPDGEGMGWRVGTDSAWDRSGHGNAAFGNVAWNLPKASVSLLANSTLAGTQRDYFQADVAGALVGIDDYWGFTRQVNDSFVLARLGVPQAGVRVLLNNQPQGRTDAQGRLLIPQVSSLALQELRVDEQDLGIQYTLKDRQRMVTPPYRSGLVVDFGIQQMHAAAGTAWLVQAGKRARIASRAWTLRGPAGTLQIETSGSGEFYLEDAPPGVYTGTLQGRERSHACRLAIPASDEPVQDLKEGITCE